MKIFQDKINDISNALPDIPFIILAAMAKDMYRKPLPGMWDELERASAVPINRSASFFVGDAAGRLFDSNTRYAKDFSASDRKLAFNAGVDFHTPEEFFLSQAKRAYFLPGLDVQSIPRTPSIFPSNTSLILREAGVEIIVMMGMPCIGKTSFYQRHLENFGYVRIHEKTRQGSVKAAELAVKAGRSCTIGMRVEDCYTCLFLSR